MKKITSSFVFAAALLSFGHVSAVQADTFTLGRTILPGYQKPNPTKVPVPVCRRADEVQIKLKKKAYISYVTLNYQGGSERKIQFNRAFREGESSKWRKLAYTRCIASIEVKGRGLDGKAGVKISGRK